jgi:hypothetical protein
VEDDELEPFEGPYDWSEAVRQNPDQGLDDLPSEAADQLGPELAQEAEEWLAVAHLGPGNDLD